MDPWNQLPYLIQEENMWNSATVWGLTCQLQIYKLKKQRFEIAAQNGVHAHTIKKEKEDIIDTIMQTVIK